MKYTKCIIGALLLLLCSIVNAQREMVIKKVQLGSSEKNYQLSKVGHYFVLNGDIIMGDDFPRTRGYVRTNAAGIPDNLWPQGYIPVMISPDVMKWDMYTSVMRALVLLNNKTNVRFKPYTNERDYIKIDMYLDDPNLGGASPVGKIGGEQVLILNRNMPESVVIHELLHALGFWHEQSRADRDSYVQVDMSMVKEGYKHNFQIEPGMVSGAYDYNSIMHYPANSFGLTDKSVTIKCKNANTLSDCKLGGDILSPKDIAALNMVFSLNQSLPRLNLENEFNIQLPNVAKGVSLEDGVYRIKVKSTAKYLDIKDISKENGAVLQQWDLFTEDNQKFAVTKKFSGVYEFKAMHSGRYLSVDRASSENLAVILQWDYANQNNQRFEVIYSEAQKGYYIRGYQSRKYWGLLGLLNGGLIIQQEKPLQVFSFEKAGNIPSIITPVEKIKTIAPVRKLSTIKSQ
jgi:Astacin (Peptidase family M12A)/Ricin-type beta-trefoil lectin domain-like